MGTSRGILAAALLFAAAAARAQAPELHAPYDRAGLLAQDALWGGVAGAALSGGFVGLRLGLGDASHDWKPALATGVGLGLVAGLLWGALQASAPQTNAMPNGPVADGLTYQETHPSERSGKFLVSFPVRRF